MILACTLVLFRWETETAAILSYLTSTHTPHRDRAGYADRKWRKGRSAIFVFSLGRKEQRGRKRYLCCFYNTINAPNELYQSYRTQMSREYYYKQVGCVNCISFCMTSMDQKTCLQPRLYVKDREKAVCNPDMWQAGHLQCVSDFHHPLRDHIPWMLS